MLVSTVYRVLTPPAYAGTYAYGRTPIEPRRRRRNGQPGIRHAPMAEWAVTLHDHLPAYIPWEHYVRNRERLRQNRTSSASRTSNPVSRGPAPGSVPWSWTRPSVS